MLIWLGRSIELLPTVLAVLLVVGGLGSLAGVSRGRVSERVLAVAIGVEPDRVRRPRSAVARRHPAGRRPSSSESAQWSTARRSSGGRAGASPGRPRIGERAHGIPAPARAGSTRRATRWPPSSDRHSRAAWRVNGWLADGAPVVDASTTRPRTLPASPGELIRVGRLHRPGSRRRRRCSASCTATTDAFGRATPWPAPW